MGRRQFESLIHAFGSLSQSNSPSCGPTHKSRGGTYISLDRLLYSSDRESLQTCPPATEQSYERTPCIVAQFCVFSVPKCSLTSPNQTSFPSFSPSFYLPPPAVVLSASLFVKKVVKSQAAFEAAMNDIYLPDSPHPHFLCVSSLLPPSHFSSLSSLLFLNHWVSVTDSCSLWDSALCVCVWSNNDKLLTVLCWSCMSMSICYGTCPLIFQIWLSMNRKDN